MARRQRARVTYPLRRRRRRVGLFATLLRALAARRQRNATARRVAAKQAQAAQKRIQRDSRTTAGKLRATGQVEWNARGMPDSTVMEPVLKNGRHTGEWVPSKTQPRKKSSPRPRAPGAVVHDGTGDPERFVSPRPPAKAGMTTVRDGAGWAYVSAGQTTAGELRHRGHAIDPTVEDHEAVTVLPTGAVLLGSREELDRQAAVQAERNRARGACGAPTQNKTPCERIGDCPIPKHVTWRAQHRR